MLDDVLTQVDRLLARGCVEHAQQNRYTHWTPVRCPWCEDWVPPGHSFRQCRMDNEGLE